MRLRTFLKPLSFLPAIFMMYIIFTFSSQEGDLSSSFSSRASYMIVKAADYVFDTGLEEWQIKNYAQKIHGVTRKVAHMTEYFLLAVAVSFPLYVYGLHGIALVLVAGLFCIAFAFTDEYHQSFVAGRQASYKDVGIDGFGILVGIILVRIIGWTGRHTIFAPDPEDRYRRMTRREIKRMKKEQQRMRSQMQKQMEEERSFYYNTHPSRQDDDGRYTGGRHGGGRYADDGRYTDEYDPEYDPCGPYDPEDEYDRMRPYPEESPDDLSDDMPFSHLLKRR